MSSAEKKVREKRKPTTFEAVSTVVFLLLTFGAGALWGLNYVPLMVVVAAYSALISWRCGYTWDEMESAVGKRIGRSVPVIMILLAIGFMLGGLMFSGTLPMLIYYGLQVVSPRWIALCAFLLCCVFSTVTGTSNGSASTAGLAMMGLAMAMPDVNLGLVAGACYAGSQFGDKLSPLSDTTVLASLTTDNDIFDHIINMSKTVVPAALIAIGIYVYIGMNSPETPAVVSKDSAALLASLSAMFKFHWVLLIPVAFLLWGSFTKKPTTLVLFGAGFIAVVIGVLYQGFSAKDAVNVLYGGFNSKMVLAAHPDFDVATMSKAAKTLLERGGIPARVITGTSRSADGTANSHAWVAAELDGAVYYFDPTWDLQDDESEAALPGYLSHTWFALTAERMAVRHTAEDPTLWPDSRANADNYYVRSGYTAAEATVAAAAAAVRSQWDDGRAVLEFRCETPEVYAGMQSLLFERDRLWDVYRALGSYVSSSGYQCADDQQIIRLIPQR